MIKRLILELAALIGRMGRNLAALPYRTMAKQVLDKIGSMLHWLLYSVVMPKRFKELSKEEIYTIIFKSDTPLGRKFDVWLLVAIVVNILVIVLESLVADPAPLADAGLMADGLDGLPEAPVHSHRWMTVVLRTLGWLFTIGFTLEYYLRIYCLKKPMRYVTSFYGVIDLLSIVPPYLGLIFPAAQSFAVLRLLRLMRVFRIFDMQQFIDEGRFLWQALRNSAVKIGIFMLFVYIASVILGTMMYVVEGDKNAVFSSIPNGIYWAVVTITTVGYGDMTPITPTGRFLSIVVMILGYSIIAVPTGIVAGETIHEHQKPNRKERRHRKQMEEEEQID